MVAINQAIGSKCGFISGSETKGQSSVHDGESRKMLAEQDYCRRSHGFTTVQRLFGIECNTAFRKSKQTVKLLFVLGNSLSSPRFAPRPTFVHLTDTAGGLCLVSCLFEVTERKRALGTKIKYAI